MNTNTIKDELKYNLTRYKLGFIYREILEIVINLIKASNFNKEIISLANENNLLVDLRKMYNSEAITQYIFIHQLMESKVNRDIIKIEKAIKLRVKTEKIITQLDFLLMLIGIPVENTAKKADKP